jgi:hypothetical protein
MIPGMPAGVIELLLSLLVVRGGPRTQVRGDDRFYAPDAPGREEDDL